jgi:hypothetical protein
MKTKQAVVLDSFNQPWALAEVPEDMRGGEQIIVARGGVDNSNAGINQVNRKISFAQKNFKYFDRNCDAPHLIQHESAYGTIYLVRMLPRYNQWGMIVED